MVYWGEASLSWRSILGCVQVKACKQLSWSLKASHVQSWGRVKDYINYKCIIFTSNNVCTGKWNKSFYGSHLCLQNKPLVWPCTDLKHGEFLYHKTEPKGKIGKRLGRVKVLFIFFSAPGIQKQLTWAWNFRRTGPKLFLFRHQLCMKYITGLETWLSFKDLVTNSLYSWLLLVKAIICSKIYASDET